MSLWTSLRHFYRYMTDRCQLCGTKRIPVSPKDLHSIGPYCRPCNKRFNHSLAYGMSPERFQTSGESASQS